jgi:hypothetical protein
VPEIDNTFGSSEHWYTHQVKTRDLVWGFYKQDLLDFGLLIARLPGEYYRPSLVWTDAEIEWPFTEEAGRRRRGLQRIIPAPGQRLDEYYFVVLWKLDQSSLEPMRLAAGEAEALQSGERLVGSASEMADLLWRINELSFAPEQDEYGPIRPSYHASKYCVKLLADFVRRHGTIRMPSDISCDRNADIRIAWTRDAKEIELVCPSPEGELPYVYHSSPEGYGTDEEIGIDRLSHWLQWVFSDPLTNA